jgi:enoyl-CoA hydratase/carnithine racemase
MLIKDEVQKCEKQKDPLWEDMDNVNHPPHYNSGNIETIDYIVDVLGKYEAISYCQGNVIKYTGSRLFSKGKPIEDAKKARWYLDKMIQLLEETKGINWS